MSRGKSSSPLRGYSILPRSFFARETEKVAIDLLGKFLLVKAKETWVGGRIVETEAYSGRDPASHSSRGMTPRCAPMFEAPGRAYVYFSYGAHDLLNFVTEPEGRAGAVLIRALEPVFGLKQIESNRKGINPRYWTSGPARLTRALRITVKDNRAELLGPRLFVLEPKTPDSALEPIRVSGRVGISKAVDVPWRFFLEGNPHVSAVPQNRTAVRLAERKAG